MSRQFGIALIKIRVPRALPIDDAILLMTETVEELRTLPDMRWLIWLRRGSVCRWRGKVGLGRLMWKGTGRMGFELVTFGCIA